ARERRRVERGARVVDSGRSKRARHEGAAGREATEIGARRNADGQRSAREVERCIGVAGTGPCCGARTEEKKTYEAEHDCAKPAESHPRPPDMCVEPSLATCSGASPHCLR